MLGLFWLICLLFPLRFELFKLINQFNLLFIELKSVTLLSLLNLCLRLNKKLPNLSSDSHSLNFSISIDSNNLRDAILSVIIEKELGDR